MKPWMKYLCWLLAVLMVGVVTLEIVAPELAPILFRPRQRSPELPELPLAYAVHSGGKQTVLTQPETEELRQILLDGTGAYRGNVLLNSDTEYSEYFDICFFSRNGYYYAQVEDGRVIFRHTGTDTYEVEVYDFDDSQLREYLKQVQSQEPFLGLSKPENLTQIVLMQRDVSDEEWLAWAQNGTAPEQSAALPETEWQDFCDSVNDSVEISRGCGFNIGEPILVALLRNEIAALRVRVYRGLNGDSVFFTCDPPGFPGDYVSCWLPGQNPFGPWCALAE